MFIFWQSRLISNYFPQSEYEEADEIDEETGIVRKVRRQTKARRVYQVIQKQRVSDSYTSNTSDTEVTVYGDDGQPIMETDSYGNSVPVRKRRPKSSRRDNKSKKSQPGNVERTGSARWDFPDSGSETVVEEEEIVSEYEQVLVDGKLQLDEEGKPGGRRE